MPDLENAVSSCPLCLGPEEVVSMVTVEIDRIVPKGRVAVMICRTCTKQVIKAASVLDDPLALEASVVQGFERACKHGYAVSNCPEGCADDSSTD